MFMLSYPLKSLQCKTENFLLNHTARNRSPTKPGAANQLEQDARFVMVLPSIMSGALPGVLPCVNAPPVQNDLVAMDAADRSNRNLQKKKTDMHLLNLTIRRHLSVFNPAVNS